MTREIPLTQGLVALVDDDDFEQLSRFKWHAERKYRARTSAVFYASRNATVFDKAHQASSKVSMHRQLLDAQKGVSIDHINGNGLDNRRRNLRVATPSENMANTHRLGMNKSGFRGVGYHRARGKWQARIGYQRSTLYLGLFDCPEGAARAYDTMAKRLFGAYARPNFYIRDIDALHMLERIEPALLRLRNVLELAAEQLDTARSLLEGQGAA